MLDFCIPTLLTCRGPFQKFIFLDVMYNGLPWPEEDFARVTVERDLKISNTLSDHPILWKLLWGIAEAR